MGCEGWKPFAGQRGINMSAADSQLLCACVEGDVDGGRGEGGERVSGQRKCTRMSKISKFSTRAYLPLYMQKGYANPFCFDVLLKMMLAKSEKVSNENSPKKGRTHYTGIHTTNSTMSSQAGD